MPRPLIDKFNFDVPLNEEERRMARCWISHHRKNAKTLIRIFETLDQQGRDQTRTLLAAAERDLIPKLFESLNIPKPVWLVVVKIVNSDEKPAEFTLANGIRATAKRSPDGNFLFEFEYDDVHFSLVRSEEFIPKCVANLMEQNYVMYYGTKFWIYNRERIDPWELQASILTKAVSARLPPSVVPLIFSRINFNEY